MSIQIRNIDSAEHLEKAVLETGFLPYFANEIPGFSIEEHTPKEYWFSDEEDGPWEWKGPVIVGGMCAYGKFFRKKAGYVSLEWLPDFINYRRSYLFLKEREAQMLATLKEKESLLSGEFRKAAGFARRSYSRRTALEKMAESEAHLPRHSESRRRGESFETAITNMQMETYVVIADFEYKHDHAGRTYGWGVARYTTPEALYGDEIVTAAHCSPQQSLGRMLDHLKAKMPEVPMREIFRMLS